jgi:hypothetical protein
MEENRSTIADCAFNPNGHSDFLLGTVLCNAFVMGEIGAEDDFFLAGVPAQEFEGYPLLTGNFLDSEGNRLFRIVRNTFVFNPRDCSKIVGNHIGFEIHDGQGNPVIGVTSKFKEIAKGRSQYFTSIWGTFYGKGGKPVVEINEKALTRFGNPKLALGFNGAAFGLVTSSMSSLEQKIAAVCLNSGGTAHQILTGRMSEKTIELDGKILVDTTIVKSKVIVRDGNYDGIGTLLFEDTGFQLEGNAARIQRLMRSVAPQKDTGDSGKMCKTSGVYVIFDHEHQVAINFQAGDHFPECPRCHARVTWVQRS